MGRTPSSLELMLDIMSNQEALVPVIQDRMMRNQEVKKTSSIPKMAWAPQKAEGLTSATLSVDEDQTWAKKLFPESNKPIAVPTEMSAKASKKNKPDIQTTVKTQQFSSNSRAPEMMKHMFIPGLFVESPKLSKRAQRAKRFKVRRLQKKV